MAVGVYLFTSPAERVGRNIVNGVECIVAGLEETTYSTSALRIARAAVLAGTAMGVTLPSTYFTAEYKLTGLDADGDNIVISGFDLKRTIA